MEFTFIVILVGLPGFFLNCSGCVLFVYVVFSDLEVLLLVLEELFVGKGFAVLADLF